MDAEDAVDGLGPLQSEEATQPPDAESLRRPRLYMDLRPFVDSGPLTVRWAAQLSQPAMLSCTHGLHVLQRMQ